MSTALIKIRETLNAQLGKYPNIKPWLWFVVLWFAGLITITTIAYIIRLVIK